MQYIKFETLGHIGILTIDREKALNALNSQVMRELGDTLEHIPGEVRVVVLTGAGEKAFAAGADISEMKDFTEARSCEFSQKGNAVCKKIEDLPVPVVAAISGFALGGGMEIALCCDIRLASETAVFALPETSLGVIPGFGGTQRLVQVVGISTAKEMIYTGKRVNAEHALKIGLVSAVYPPDELLAEAIALAGKIADNAPIAVRGAKRAINEGLVFGIGWGLKKEPKIFSSCFGTQDQKNAMEAFLTKKNRKPFINE